LELSPYEVKGMVNWLLTTEENKHDLYLTNEEIARLTSDSNSPETFLSSSYGSYLKTKSMLRRRQIEGSLSRVPRGFYDRVYKVLERCTGLKIDGRYLDSSTTAEMTSGEKNFCLRVEHLLDVISSPSVRQIIVETLYMLGEVLQIRQGFVNMVIDIPKLVNITLRLWLEARMKRDSDTQEINELISQIKDNSDIKGRLVDEFLGISPLEYGAYFLKASVDIFLGAQAASV